jgi:ribosomal protein S27AE
MADTLATQYGAVCTRCHDVVRTPAHPWCADCLAGGTARLREIQALGALIAHPSSATMRLCPRCQQTSWLWGVTSDGRWQCGACQWTQDLPTGTAL